MQSYEELEYELAIWHIEQGLGWSSFSHRNVVVCASGTAALHLALECLPERPYEKVLVPDFAMYACGRAVHLSCRIPAFIDCNDLLNIDPGLVEMMDSYGGNYLLMAVHTYGRPCDMDRLSLFCKLHDVPVLEDMAEIHGVMPHKETAVACYSFYKNKLIHGEEGGCLLFQDVQLADKARQLRNLGFTPSHDFTHIPGGHNYRMANLLATPIIESLRNYEKELLDRQVIEQWYQEYCPREWQMPTRRIPWVYDIRIKDLTTQKQTAIVRTLQAAGIEARHAFKPLSTQEEFRGLSQYSWVDKDTQPTWAQIYSTQVLYLPITPGVITRDICQKSFNIIQAILDS